MKIHLLANIIITYSFRYIDKFIAFLSPDDSSSSGKRSDRWELKDGAWVRAQNDELPESTVSEEKTMIEDSSSQTPPPVKEGDMTIEG